MKKDKITIDDAFKLCISKELEKYGKTYDDVYNLPGGMIDDTPWYQYYTFDTKEEYEEWKNFCLDIFEKKVSPKMNKKNVQREFLFFDLGWGLKCKYLHHTFEKNESE